MTPDHLYDSSTLEVIWGQHCDLCPHHGVCVYVSNGDYGEDSRYIYLCRQCLRTALTLADQDAAHDPPFKEAP